MDLLTTNPLLQSIVELLRRHVLLVGSVFTVMSVTLMAYIYSLPNVYISTTSIAVDGQQISKDLVPSTMTLGVEGRLRVLSQRILSRARLGQIAEQFGLYPELRRERQSAEVVAKTIRSDIGLQVRNESDSANDARVTFDISYRGTDPEKVRQITDSLALFYIEENKKDRQEHTAGTTEFLRAQLRETKEKLESQERQVAEYKQRHIEELPEHLVANLATLGQVRTQLDSASTALAAAQQRREMLNRRVALINSTPIASLVPSGVRDGAEGSTNNGDGRLTTDGGTGGAQVTDLEGMKSRLAQMLIRFSEKHPDVAQLRKEIALLEQKIASQPVPLAPARVNASNAASQSQVLSPTQMVTAAAESARRTTELTNLQTETAGLEIEIQRNSAEIARLRGQISVYQDRVASAPKRDQELQKLSRDYASTHELYLSLLKRLDEATLASNLDQSRQGEQFTVIEPALYPRDPAGPRRRLLSLGAILLSLGAALAVVLLREVVNPVFHKLEDLRSFTTVEILGSVPKIATEAEWTRQRMHRFVGGVALVTIVCGIGALSHTYGKESAQVAKALSQSTGGIKLH